MIANDKILQIIDQYKSNFEEICKGERYKWEAIKWFQDHWDIEAGDFGAMLLLSTKKTYNLLASMRYTPLGTIKYLTKQEPEAIRRIFRNLYDEQKNLDERVSAFQSEISNRVKASNPKNNHYQDMRAISVWLTLKFPEKYNFYKSTVYKEFAAMTNLDGQFAFKSDVTAIHDAMGIVDVILPYIKQDSELLEISRNTLSETEYADPAFRVLAQDIIYSIRYQAAKPEKIPVQPQKLVNPVVAEGKRVWLFQPGRKSEFWNECLENGIMGLNYGEIGDLANYANREAIAADLKAMDPNNQNPVFSSLALWQIANEVKVGDMVLVKGGKTKLLGMGHITTDYRYSPEYPDYEQTREVKWEVTGNWEIEGINFHIKTLTDLTPYPDYVKRILDAMQKPGHYEMYSEDDFLDEVFISREQLHSIMRLVRNKKNIILQGPPGVGKTFSARRLAYVLMGKKDTSRVETIQFHQSYSYEDFVQGIRPTTTGFALKNGVFYDFCQMAASDKSQDYYFIIDEINRGNLSKILGELMMLIEPDKRGIDYQIPLTYSESEEFYVPENVYLIGMMNTADRSLAMMDYALRRRFSFVTLEPAFETASFTSHLSKSGLAEPLIQRICRVVGDLNNEIQNDSNLGRGFLVGHSYFCNSPGDNVFEWLEDVVECDLGPLIDEYWYDDEAKAAEYKALLRELYE